jgi:hypothetical protein
MHHPPQHTGQAGTLWPQVHIATIGVLIAVSAWYFFEHPEVLYCMT